MKYITNEREIEFTTILEDKENATTFRHFKNKDYKIITIAKNCDSLEDVVIYQAQYGDKSCWTRKPDEFFSKVDKEKYPEVLQKYRFEKLD